MRNTTQQKSKSFGFRTNSPKNVNFSKSDAHNTAYRFQQPFPPPRLGNITVFIQNTLNFTIELLTVKTSCTVENEGALGLKS
jgi:hypothetical protein